MNFYGIEYLLTYILNKQPLPRYSFILEVALAWYEENWASLEEVYCQILDN